jgi:hypothetical protein
MKVREWVSAVEPKEKLAVGSYQFAVKKITKKPQAV